MIAVVMLGENGMSRSTNLCLHDGRKDSVPARRADVAMSITPTVGLNRRPNKGEQHAKVLSKYTGVSYAKVNKNWMVSTGGGQNLRWHGVYDTEHEAARARNQAMIERFGHDPKPNTFEHIDCLPRYKVSGDHETIIRSISFMRIRGLGVLVIRPKEKETMDSMRGRLSFLKHLLLAQSCVEDLRLDNSVFDVDLNECTLEIGGPWLTVPEIKKVARVLIHRRHVFGPAHGDMWRPIIQRLGHECAFVGDKGELQIFRTQTQAEPIPVSKPKNLLDAAQMIAGCELFIGNKSPMMAIADGLGIKTVAEGTSEFVTLASPTPTQCEIAHVS